MEFQLPDSNWTPGLVFAGFVITLGVAVPAGFQGSIINAPAEYIQAWCRAVISTRFGIWLSDEELNLLWASIVTVAILFGVFISIFGGILTCKFGRKKSFLICGIVLALAAPCFLLCRTTSSIELLFLGRAIAGSGLGLAIAVLPLYLTELSPLKLRGAVGVLVPIGITAGVVLGQVVGLDQVLGDEDSWQYALSCYALMLVLCFVPYCWLPESPEYLFKVKNDPEGAVEAIRKIFGQHSVGDDYFMCVKVDHVDCEKTKSMSLLAVLKDPSLRLPLVLLCCMSAGNGFSGINAIFFYSVSTLERIGLPANEAKLVSVGLGCVNLVCSACGPYLMARFNRRPLMLISCTACSITLLLVTLMIIFVESVTWFAEASIAAMLLFIIAFQIGVGQIPFFIGSVKLQLFNLDARSSAIALGSLGAGMSNLIISMVFPIMQHAWGAYAFLPFSVYCVMLAALVKRFLPETRGRSVGDVARLMANGFRKFDNPQP
ncbi:solute carrier family 2 [Culex quinquefasciatus]|uniref:Solute carrier family 2 n=1 Tax=Culex quinquefasciatus TaxID=7176 RepID=B0XJK1_CULQU|nr:solute carrier family 2 [Culex quinquefasciatus]|eukprot:XP_001869823.1 solute carrier family 2 [Culex quinquefasciatus]